MSSFIHKRKDSIISISQMGRENRFQSSSRPHPKENYSFADMDRANISSALGGRRAFGRDISNIYHEVNSFRQPVYTHKSSRSGENLKSIKNKSIVINLRGESETISIGKPHSQPNSQPHSLPKCPKPPIVDLLPEVIEEKLHKYKEEMETLVREETLEIDIPEYNNPQHCIEYIRPICTYLRAIENDHMPGHGYFERQRDINEKMRAILIDWLIEVHSKFRLLPETLFLTCNIIDRYLEKEIIMRQKLQLVGVTAMLIASKYEEIYAPEVKDFVYITDKAYTKDQILAMEHKILDALEFNLNIPSAYRFLQRYAKLAKVDDLCLNLCKYLIELPLIHYKMLKYQPSELATAALFLGMKILKYEFSWSKDIQPHLEYSETSVRPCAKELCLLLQNAEKTSLQAVRKKFITPKFSEVAKIKIEPQYIQIDYYQFTWKKYEWATQQLFQLLLYQTR